MLGQLLRWCRTSKVAPNGEQFATQQVEYLGKVADGVVVYPYGFHASAAVDSIALMMAVNGDPDNRALIPWAHKDKPELAEGEVAFYHPQTKAFIIWRATGDLEIVTGKQGAGNINITCAQANVTASDSVNVDSPITNLGVGGPEIARLGDEVEVTVTAGSSAGTYTGTITSAGTNTSI